MTDAARAEDSSAMPAPYRERVKVLCLFTYRRRLGGALRPYRGSQMIDVEFSDQIRPTFDAWVKDWVSLWDGKACGSPPVAVTLTAYITSNGKQNF